MPNWCSNKLEITGTKKEILKFYQDNKNTKEKQELDFYKVYPMPDKVYKGQLGIEERKRYNNNNWYDWNCENIGTKWNVRDSSFTIKENIYKKEAFNAIKTIYLKTNLQLGQLLKKMFISYTGYYLFDTAWSPPVKWLENISKKYKNINIKLTFIEEGCDFAGFITYENGILKDNIVESASEYLYKENKDEINALILKIIKEKNLDINCKSDFEVLQEQLEENYYYYEDNFLENILSYIYDKKSN